MYFWRRISHWLKHHPLRKLFWYTLEVDRNMLKWYSANPWADDVMFRNTDISDWLIAHYDYPVPIHSRAPTISSLGAEWKHWIKLRTEEDVVLFKLKWSKYHVE
jgi:hypothetical protein